VDFKKVIGDLLAAALRSRKVKKLIGDQFLFFEEVVRSPRL
jgi:hypothetical protein